MTTLPVLLIDGYKADHRRQYPNDTLYIYSNLTPRAGRSDQFKGVITFGLQYFIKEFLQTQFNEGFFNQPLEVVLAEYREVMDSYLGPEAIPVAHIAELWELGYLPLLIKAIPEGTFVPYGVPILTITNTKPEFFWLTNMVETLLSSVLWKMTTSATMAQRFYKNFNDYANVTGNPALVPFQGHDFSFRGMSGPEDAARSGAAHLTSFLGTDTVPALPFLRDYYGADLRNTAVGLSVPATEHSVMCMGGDATELDTFRRLLRLYPKGIVSVVSDTWDYWNVLTEILPQLKEEILARDGKLVIRPDSGDPVKILTGDFSANRKCIRDGTVETLFKLFGGTMNSKGFIDLNPHIGVIYGDSINLDRQERILANLMTTGFASTNVVLGIGSYTYQYTTRDVHGFAMKATSGVTVSSGRVEIYKDPVTDDGVKKSHRGLLAVHENSDGSLYVKQQCTETEETKGLLRPVFEDGELLEATDIYEIRSRVHACSN